MSKHKTKNKVRDSLIIALGFVAIVGVIYYYGKAQAENASQNVAGVAGPGGGGVIVQPNCSSIFTPAIRVTPIFATATSTPIAGSNNDRALFTVKFTIKAGKCDLYIARGSGALGQIQKMGASTIIGSSYGSDFMSQYNNHIPTTNNNWKLPANTANDFWVKFYLTNSDVGSAGQYRAFLREFKWGTNDLANLPNAYRNGMGTVTTTTPYTTSYIAVD